MIIKLIPRYALAALIAGIGVIHLLNALAIGLKTRFDGEYYRFTEFFDVGIEGNIPTVYSTLQLGLAAAVSALIAVVIAKQQGRDSGYWYGLAVAFLFLSFDEGATIHETVGRYTELWFENLVTGYLYFIWVIPYGIAVMWFAAAYFPFLLRLPKRTAIGLVVSGAIFVGGAIGVEAISAAVNEAAFQLERRPLEYYLLYSLEEFIEMFGIALFIFYALDYLATRSEQVSIRLSE